MRLSNVRRVLARRFDTNDHDVISDNLPRELATELPNAASYDHSRGDVSYEFFREIHRFVQDNKLTVPRFGLGFVSENKF